MLLSRIHIHRRELGFLGWIGTTLVLIGGYLLSGQDQVDTQGSGWRRLDLKALQLRIDGGELRDREAIWYRPLGVKQEGSPP